MNAPGGVRTPPRRSQQPDDGRTTGQQVGHRWPLANGAEPRSGEHTIVGLEGQRQVVRAGDAIVEMVGPIHCGMNTGDKPIVLDMFYLAQEGMPLAVQHPEVQKPME